MHVRPFLSAIFLAASAALAHAQVDYRLAFQPGGASWEVEARFPVRGADTLDFRIARWTAGAYHVADYGRFVKELAATDVNGTALAVEREGDSRFLVRCAGADEVVLRYRGDSISRSIFTDNVIDVESNRIAQDYAYVNPVSLFGFVPERVDEPVRLALELPAGWKAATVLRQDAEGRYEAPSFYRFEDSPFLFAKELTTVEFEVEGKPHAVTVHGKSAEETRALAATCQKIVGAAAKLMQGLPYDRYHFLFGFVPEAQGSGLEHSFSTLILVKQDVQISEESGPFWDIVAHEFFHLWCAERIHVAALERPDYTQPFESGTIWVNEGITQYFTQHVLLHAGLLEPVELLQDLLAEPFPAELPFGKKSWTDVSRAAREWKDFMALGEFAFRMYFAGPRTILGLDLAMRSASDGERGVLDLLRFLRWAYVEEGRGFGEGEMPALINGIAEADLGDFYARYIDGPELPDVPAALAVIGYRLDGGKVVALESPSEAQLAARADFFSADG